MQQLKFNGVDNQELVMFSGRCSSFKYCIMWVLVGINICDG